MLKPQNLGQILEDDLYKKVDEVLTPKNLDIRDTYCFPRKLKDRFECLAHTLVQFIYGSNVGKKLEIDEALNRELGQLLASVAYLCNSTSFRIGKYQQFDKDEIDRKLQRRQK